MYDDYGVDQDLGYMNKYWLMAIGSVRYKQDLYTMDESAIEDMMYDRLTYSTSLIDRILNIFVRDLTPEEYMGDIIGDLNKRRGQVSGMEQKGNARAIKAKVPLSEMFGYVTVLRTLSSGRATSSMEFSHFEEVPANIAKEIIEKNAGRRKDVE